MTLCLAIILQEREERYKLVQQMKDLDEQAAESRVGKNRAALMKINYDEKKTDR
ncbi:MAG: hypothetical protein HYX72_13995 [Acidobacteria bacterium]|nr:hypothetical protein [Acidobacteriota bacterium]